jgi:hypothetical protein
LLFLGSEALSAATVNPLLVNAATNLCHDIATGGIIKATLSTSHANGEAKAKYGANISVTRILVVPTEAPTRNSVKSKSFICIKNALCRQINAMS